MASGLITGREDCGKLGGEADPNEVRDRWARRNVNTMEGEPSMEIVAGGP